MDNIMKIVHTTFMAAICCGLLASCSLFHRTSLLEDEMTLRNLTEQEHLQKEANKRQLREEILKGQRRQLSRFRFEKIRDLFLRYLSDFCSRKTEEN